MRGLARLNLQFISPFQLPDRKSEGESDRKGVRRSSRQVRRRCSPLWEEMSSRKHLSVEILQNSEVVKVGLTKNYRFRKNGVTHKLTLTPKRGFDKTYEGNWTCRVQFLGKIKKRILFKKQKIRR